MIILKLSDAEYDKIKKEILNLKKISFFKKIKFIKKNCWSKTLK